MMRTVRIGLAAAIAATILVRPASAAPVYPYCAQYQDRGDMTCAYETFQQCLDTARGPAGGSCTENPAWRPAPVAPVRAKPKRFRH